MFTPHCGHGFAPMLFITFSDCLSSACLALSQPPDRWVVQGRLHFKQISYSQYGHEIFCLPRLSLLQASIEKCLPHFSERQAM